MSFNNALMIELSSRRMRLEYKINGILYYVEKAVMRKTMI